MLNAGESSVSLSNLASAGITVDVVGQKSGTANIGFAATNKSGALALGLDGVGAAKAGTATANTYVTVNATVATGGTAITELTVNATGDNFADLTSAGAAKNVTVAGEGNLDVNAVNAALTSFDASAAQGNITADLTNAAASSLASVKGGEGDDNFKVAIGDLTGTAALAGGAGNNTLILSGEGTIQPTMSQFQTVVLDGITAGGAVLSGKNISDLETVQLSGSGIGTNTVTLAGVQSSALNVETVGSQGAGTVILTSATDLTYTANATAKQIADKAADTTGSALAITAGEATNATINVGAYANVGGTISVNKANAVTLNVASGKNTQTPAVEQTTFAGTISADAAQAVTVNAEGKLGAATAINAKTASVADVTAKAGGNLALSVEKAQQVNVTAGAALSLNGSNLGAAEQVNIAANGGKVGKIATTDTAVSLGKINSLNLSGTAATSAVELGALGSATDITNAINVTATGLKGGAEVGNIDTKGGNVTLTATEMTGHFKAGNIGSGSNKVGNVTVNAATLGSTEIGNIDTVANANVQVNALDLLGKVAATGLALKVGNVAVADDTVKTGTITVNLSSADKFQIGTLSAKTVNVDLSGYLGGDIGAALGTPATVNGQLGVITGQNVTVKGTELGANAVEVAVATVANQTSTINVTGGLKDDVLTIDVGTGGIAANGAAAITFTGGEGTGDRIVFKDTADLHAAAGSKLTLNGVETIEVANSKTVTVKAADLSGMEITKGGTGTGTLVLKGTDGADTIDASNITGAITIQGGKGNDTIKLGAALETVKFSAVADNGADTITGFTAGTSKDVLDFSAILGGTGASLNTTAVSGTDTSAATWADKAVTMVTVDDVSTVSFTEANFFAASKAFAAEGSSAKAGIFLVGEATGTNGVKVYAVTDGTDADDLAITLVGTLSGVALNAGFVAGNVA